MRGVLLALACVLAAPSALADEPAGPAVSTDETVTLNLDGVPLAKVLEMFAVEHHLNVVAGSDVTGTVTVNLYRVPAEDALRKVLEVNGYGFVRDGSFYVVRKLDAMTQDSDDPVQTAVVWLDYVPADEALKLVLPLKSETGVFTAGTRASQGLSSDGNDAGGNSPAAGEVIVLKDRASVVTHVREVLEELDRKPRQVRIEATILEVKLTD
ncbi:MAG: secretin and TonB N-terminal domain-containing protein, partial [Planctomycetes bacterium]|nr:secretin and TonB N-terminal domain-containing protein [Planctomycetota bacterium]